MGQNNYILGAKCDIDRTIKRSQTVMENSRVKYDEKTKCNRVS